MLTSAGCLHSSTRPISRKFYGEIDLQLDSLVNLVLGFFLRLVTPTLANKGQTLTYPAKLKRQGPLGSFSWLCTCMHICGRSESQPTREGHLDAARKR